MHQPSIEADTEFHVGQIVELHATVCTAPCESDCGCREMVSRNGHQGAVLAVQPPMFGGEPHYRVDGIDSVLYAYELRAVKL